MRVRRRRKRQLFDAATLDGPLAEDAAVSEDDIYRTFGWAGPGGPGRKRAVAYRAVARGVLAFVAILAACGGHSSPAATGSTTTATGSTTTPSSTSNGRPGVLDRSFSRGQCVKWPAGDSDAWVTAVDVNCSGPHFIEMTGSVDLRSRFADYPSDADWQVLFQGDCKRITEQYLGTPLDPHGRYASSGLYPLRPLWDEGKRTLHCGIQATNPGNPGVGGIQTATLFAGRADGHAQTFTYPVGTCLAPLPGNTSVAIADCVSSHAIEITGTVDITGRIDHAPSTNELSLIVNTDCSRLAVAYLGRNPAPPLYSGWLAMDPASWAAGRRTIECTIERAVNGSMAPSAGPFRTTR
jgi:hypothetical protein